MTLTYSVAEAADMIPCSERWLADGLRSGRFTGHRIMGQWRLTDGDLEEILRACVAVPKPPESDTPAFEFITRNGIKAVPRPP